MDTRVDDAAARKVDGTRDTVEDARMVCRIDGNERHRVRANLRPRWKGFFPAAKMCALCANIIVGFGYPVASADAWRGG